MALYHYESCPFCRKVREVADRLDLDIELRNIRKDIDYRDELKNGVGQTQVPCLRIEGEDETRWLYESDDIIAFLMDVFGQEEA